MISDFEFRIADLRKHRAQSKNPGGKNLKAVFPYWLLTSTLLRYAPCAMRFAVYNQ